MNGTNLFKIAFRALANNKLRAFLTMLGIIIGVASVITMLAIGQGSKKSIQAQISEMGSNMIMIHPGADMRGGVRQDPSAMQTLKLTDYEALCNETNFLAAVSPNVSSSGQLIAGNNNYPSSVSGVGTDNGYDNGYDVIPEEPVYTSPGYDYSTPDSPSYTQPAPVYTDPPAPVYTNPPAPVETIPAPDSDNMYD